jgi:hypothetical protein
MQGAQEAIRKEEKEERKDNQWAVFSVFLSSCLP